MAGRHVLSRLLAVLLALLPLSVVWSAGAEEAPAHPTAEEAPAHPTAEEAPADPANDDLISGVEGSKAALVQIEVSATAEIAHVDHTTGEVEVARGKYTVPIRTATGVFLSSDGVIATAGHTLTVTEDEVVVYAANMLFQEHMGTALVGNDGDPTRRAEAVDPYWAPHLQHCYEQVEHCVLFFVPHYEVVPYAEDPVGTPADVLWAPQESADPGLLRISGGGGIPTAQLTAPDHQVEDHGLLMGFAEPPAPGVSAMEMGVHMDAAGGSFSVEGDMSPLDTGLAGGPVVDPTTGAVVGLASSVDGTPALIPAQAVHDALAAAGVEPTGSQFDAVFRRGVDHLASGHASGSAASSFEEALTYYDSALAARYLAEAEAAGAAEEPAPATKDDDGGSPLSGPTFWVTLGVLVLLALLAVALFLRGRGRRLRGGAADPSSPPVPQAVAPRREQIRTSAPTGGGPAPEQPSGAVPTRTPAGGAEPRERERTRLRQSPAMVKEPLPPTRPAPAFCWDCGGPLRDRARFCASCGSPVS